MLSFVSWKNLYRSKIHYSQKQWEKVDEETLAKLYGLRVKFVRKDEYIVFKLPAFSKQFLVVINMSVYSE